MTAPWGRGVWGGQDSAGAAPLRDRRASVACHRLDAAARIEEWQRFDDALLLTQSAATRDARTGGVVCGLFVFGALSSRGHVCTRADVGPHPLVGPCEKTLDDAVWSLNTLISCLYLYILLYAASTRR